MNLHFTINNIHLMMKFLKFVVFKNLKLSFFKISKNYIYESF